VLTTIAVRDANELIRFTAQFANLLERAKF
jgi:hypothetical protein